MENRVSFSEYTSWFDKFKNNNDIREINFQNEVVKKSLDILLDERDIVDCSRKGTETTNHDYSQYCGKYIDKTGKEKCMTPDLVIAKNWNWLNKENKVDYCAVVEVKSPYLQPIYHKNYNEYSNELKEELQRHLLATKNERVILTDALKWEFYKKDKKLIPIKTFELYKLGSGGSWSWECEEFDALQSFLINFIG